MRYLSVIFLAILITFGLSQPINAQYVLGAGFYNWDNPAFSYPNHTWSTVVDSLNYFGNRRSSGFTTTTNPEIVFQFWGTAFTFFTIRNSGQTDVNVCVDAVCSYVSFYSASTEYGYSFTVSGLSLGVHSVSIKKAVTTNTALNFDALFVHPYTATPQPPVVNVTLVMPTPQPTPTGTQFVYVGNFPEITEEASVQRLEIAGRETTITYDINPLEVVIVVMLGFIIIVMGAGFVVKIWGAK